MSSPYYVLIYLIIDIMYIKDLYISNVNLLVACGMDAAKLEVKPSPDIRLLGRKGLLEVEEIDVKDLVKDVSSFMRCIKVKLPTNEDTIIICWANDYY